MLDTLYGKISTDSPGAVIIISVALMIFFGFAMTRITKKLRLPNVTAYIVAGILIGPACLDLIPNKIIIGTDFLSDIALAFIAFSVGEFFKISKLKKNGLKSILITLIEAAFTSIPVFFLLRFVFKMSFDLTLLLAALASATAPASTIMTIRQTKAKGDLVETLMQVIALDNVVGLLAYSIALSVAISYSAQASLDISAIIIPIIKNIFAIAIGAFLGFVMKLLISHRSNDNRLIISVGIMFLFCGICAVMNVSPLLGCMMIGAVYTNLSYDSKLFLQIEYFTPPLLLLFFVRSGLNFDLSALLGSASLVGIAPLWAVSIIYFFIRMIGKYIGALLGCLSARKESKTRKHLGLAMFPHAGVAIGLAAMGARSLGGETGSILQTIILASSIMYELVGPVLAKLALQLSGSYSDNIGDKKEKSDIEIVIELIRKIQIELLPRVQDSQFEAEQAFTEAAEEHFISSNLNFGGDSSAHIHQ